MITPGEVRGEQRSFLDPLSVGNALPGAERKKTAEEAAPVIKINGPSRAQLELNTNS